MSREMRAKYLDVIAHAVGALVLSRACPDDSPLADEILETCRSVIQSNLPALPELVPGGFVPDSRAPMG